jgi:hypothetical protein
MEQALAAERAARKEAETTLALLREKTKEKFLGLKTENEELKWEIEKLKAVIALAEHEEDIHANEWNSLKDSIKALEQENGLLRSSKKKPMLVQDSSEMTFFSDPSSSTKLSCRQLRIFSDQKICIFPSFSTPLISSYSDHDGKDSHGSMTPPVLGPERSRLTAWSLERDRLRERIIELENRIEKDSLLLSDSKDLNVQLRLRLKQVETDLAVLSKQDNTQILYAKNVFEKLYHAAPKGNPEFDQLLLVLAAFFGISSEK